MDGCLRQAQDIPFFCAAIASVKFSLMTQLTVELIPPEGVDNALEISVVLSIGDYLTMNS